MSALHADALRVLGTWRPDDPEQERLRTTYVDHLLTHDDGTSRSCVPAHLTASALLLDGGATRVLLTLHSKGGFWAQLGGHAEPGDETLAGAAMREAREESGVDGLRMVGDRPVDLDRHALSAAFGACREHLDVRYAVVVPDDARVVVSDESRELAWFRVDALPEGRAGIDGLVRRAVAAVRADAPLG